MPLAGGGELDSTEAVGCDCASYSAALVLILGILKIFIQDLDITHIYS